MPRPKKVVETTELPITIELRIAGQDQTIKTDNILSALRDLKIDPLKIKSRATFEITANGGTYRRILSIIQVKRLLVNDVFRQIICKQFSQAVGLTY